MLNRKFPWIFRLSGGSRGGPGGPTPHPLFLDQTEARRAEKHFFQTAPHSLIWRSGFATGLIPTYLSFHLQFRMILNAFPKARPPKWSLLMTTMLSERSYEKRKRVACENIRFSSLFIAGDVSRGVWNFCRWVADVPPRETSPAAKSEEKRMFSQARKREKEGRRKSERKRSRLTCYFYTCYLSWELCGVRSLLCWSHYLVPLPDYPTF